MSTSASSRQPPPGGSLDLWVIGIGVAAAIVAGWLWAAGELAAALTTGRFPSIGGSGALSVAVGVLTRPGEPGGAWPAGAHVPGPLWYWSTAGVLALLGVTTAFVGVAAVRRARRPARAGGHRRPGFATPVQVRAELGTRARRRRAVTVRPSLGCRT